AAKEHVCFTAATNRGSAPVLHPPFLLAPACDILAPAVTKGGHDHEETYASRPLSWSGWGRCCDAGVAAGARSDLAKPPGHYHLPLGRGRGHGRHGAYRRGGARKGPETAFQRHQPHRRFGRGGSF